MFAFLLPQFPGVHIPVRVLVTVFSLLAQSGSWSLRIHLGHLEELKISLLSLYCPPAVVCSIYYFLYFIFYRFSVTDLDEDLFYLSCWDVLDMYTFFKPKGSDLLGTEIFQPLSFPILSGILSLSLSLVLVISVTLLLDHFIKASMLIFFYYLPWYLQSVYLISSICLSFYNTLWLISLDLSSSLIGFFAQVCLFASSFPILSWFVSSFSL